MPQPTRTPPANPIHQTRTSNTTATSKAKTASKPTYTTPSPTRISKPSSKFEPRTKAPTKSSAPSRLPPKQVIPQTPLTPTPKLFSRPSTNKEENGDPLLKPSNGGSVITSNINKPHHTRTLIHTLSTRSALQALHLQRLDSEMRDLLQMRIPALERKVGTASDGDGEEGRVVETIDPINEGLEYLRAVEFGDKGKELEDRLHNLERAVQDLRKELDGVAKRERGMLVSLKGKSEEIVELRREMERFKGEEDDSGVVWGGKYGVEFKRARSEGWDAEDIFDRRRHR
ncbi:hypothetical protein P154DRAFT_528396 [Amniculicola lignicola CBS 123094]|uniref:Uncharacterized protein n=1 Tax=Amniculicola lignicola CBS 123094 TaxID=1392246 RepID=A0A6A5X483_9PLEO|nr:hypothetical protein P154DRAFT_528396 [Amniculicola lignicola CBS 123094]